MLVVTLLGFAGGILYIAVAFFMSIGKDREERAFNILNLPGYNIGNFTMPFAQSFLGPVGVVATSLFDTGNAFICLGGAYSACLLYTSTDCLTGCRRFLLRKNTKFRHVFGLSLPKC